MRIAKFKVVAGGLLGVLGIASSLILWGLGDTGDDKTSKGAYIRRYEANQLACLNASDESTRVASVTPDLQRFGSIAVPHQFHGLAAGFGQKQPARLGGESW